MAEDSNFSNVVPNCTLNCVNEYAPRNNGDITVGASTHLTVSYKRKMKETISSLHQLTMALEHQSVREAALASLELIVESYPLLVLQTWLMQFARTNATKTVGINGGRRNSSASLTSSSMSYVNKISYDHVLLLESLQRLFENSFIPKHLIDVTNVAHSAVLGRIIALIAEEMLNSQDIVQDIQKPCSIILSRIGVFHLDRVMDVLLPKFQVNQIAQFHYYFVLTLGTLAQANPTGIMQYIKTIFSYLIPSLKLVKKEKLKIAYAQTLSRFSEAILDQVANNEQLSAIQSSGLVSDDQSESNLKKSFVNEIDLCHEVLFSQWLSSSSARDPLVKQTILEAIGQMAPLVSDARLYKYTPQILTLLITFYKKSSIEPFFITQCISQTVKSATAKDSLIFDHVLELLLTALFYQISQTTDFAKSFSIKNQNEVLRCYDQLISSHCEKLVSGLLLRLNSGDENIRLAALTVLKRLMTSSMDSLTSRMSHIYTAIHSKLTEPSYKVRKMLAEVTALLGRLGFLEGSRGNDFIDFIIRNCRQNAPDGSTMEDLNDVAKQPSVNNESLNVICGNILLLLTNSTDITDSLLWPHLLGYLMDNSLTDAIPFVIKSLSILASRKAMSPSPDYLIDYTSLSPAILGPYVLFARLIVLACNPLPHSDSRVESILLFLASFAPNINKKLSKLWHRRLPLLQHYLTSHVASSWDQIQWESWLLLFINDTLSEIDYGEWTTALTGAFCQQIGFYISGIEKCFILRCIGQTLAKVPGSMRQFIMDNLALVFSSTNHFDLVEQSSCAKSFGVCGSQHLHLVLDKLEQLLKTETQKKNSSFFGFLRDNKATELQVITHCTILACIGEVALCADISEISDKIDIITQRFIMPVLRSKTQSSLKIAALDSLARVACSIHTASKTKKALPGVTLTYHGDLLHETIEYMRIASLEDADVVEAKRGSLVTAFELIKIRPFISQLTRCTLLKTCFNFVFPFITLQREDGLTVYSVVRSMSDQLIMLVQELLRQDLEQSTLDEIYTLLEIWLKQPDHLLARQLASILLYTALQTFTDNFSFKTEGPSCFSPGAYIIGSVVPRCFEASAGLQSISLKSLELLLTISAFYEGYTKETISDQISKLRILCCNSSITPGLSFCNIFETEVLRANEDSVIIEAVSQVLADRVICSQLSCLTQNLIEGCVDMVAGCGNGTASILCCLLKSRGKEIRDQAENFVVKIYTQLSENLESDQASTVDRTDTSRDACMLSAIRQLTLQSPRNVVSSLLQRNRWPYDEALISVWKTLVYDQKLAATVIHYLLDEILPFCYSSYNDQENVLPVSINSFGLNSGSNLSGWSCWLYKECGIDTLLECPIRIANHRPLAAIAALGIMCEMREMEHICEIDFGRIFVPLLLCMGSYVGIKSIEEAPKKKSELNTKITQAMVSSCRSSLPGNNGKLNAYIVTRNALSACLSCRGAVEVSNTLDRSSTLENGVVGRNSDLLSFSNVVADLIESVIIEIPQCVSILVAAFRSVSGIEDYRNFTVDGQRLATVSFFAQVVKSSSPVATNLIEVSLDRLMDFFKDDSNDLIRHLALKGLSAYKLDISNRGSVLLNCLVRGIDDTSSLVNLSALEGLISLLPSLSTNCTSLVQRELHSIADKTRPFFDNAGNDHSTAAILLFRFLADFANKQCFEIRNAFYDQVHPVFVSLLLKVNDDTFPAVRSASHKALIAIFELFSSDENSSSLKNVIQNHLIEKDDLVYADFLKSIFEVRSAVLVEMYLVYVSTCCSYFHSSKPILKCNAIQLLSILLLPGIVDSDISSSESSEISEIDSDKICSEFRRMMLDSNVDVRTSAANFLGSVFILLYKDII